MTFDELIAQGMRDTLEEKCAEYRTTGKKHRFSPAYKIMRFCIIHFKIKKPLSIRSVKRILTAVTAALFTLMFIGLFKYVFKERSK